MILDSGEPIAGWTNDTLQCALYVCAPVVHNGSHSLHSVVGLNLRAQTWLHHHHPALHGLWTRPFNTTATTAAAASYKDHRDNTQ